MVSRPVPVLGWNRAEEPGCGPPFGASLAIFLPFPRKTFCLLTFLSRRSGMQPWNNFSKRILDNTFKNSNDLVTCSERRQNKTQASVLASLFSFLFRPSQPGGIENVRASDPLSPGL